MASSEPAAWQRVRELTDGRVAVAYAVDLAGALDVLDRHLPAVVILSSRLIDATLEEALRALRRRRRPGTSLLVISRGDDAQLAPELPRLADGWLEDASLPRLLPLLLGCQFRAAAPPATAPAATMQVLPVPDPALPGAGAAPAAHAGWSGRAMILGRSPKTVKLIETARRVATEPVTVLLTGETGTGKEMIARWIHSVSLRAAGPFRVVDLPSIPDELFESTLFGHERGAFTGAVSPQPGKFRRAHGGTLFLDEVSSLKPALQPKLLRAIQEKEVESVGGREAVPCDVRIIAATNTDLGQAVRRGEFRADLYYRLRVVTLDLPPLRDRREDIPELCQLFVSQAAARLQRPPPVLPPHVLRALEGYHWPGNVRELENWVQRAVLASQGGHLDDFEELLLELDPARAEPCLPQELDECRLSLEEMERLYVLRVLERTAGNQSQAAQVLGIDRKTLRAKLQKAPEGQPVRTLRSVR